MAHIFKKPGNTKGIIVLTHKEILKENFYVDVPYIKSSLSKDYFIGCHLGGNIRKATMPDYVDFCMGLRDTGSFRNEDTFHRIPLNSKNFVESYFGPKEKDGGVITPREMSDREWDFLCVSSHSPVKNLDKMIKAFELIFKRYRKNYRVLLVTSHGDPDYYEELYRRFIRPLTMRYDAYFKVMKASEQEKNRNNFWIGYSRRQMLEFYQNSKILMLFSEREGANKTVAEGLVCGLPIFAYKKLSGGGLDGLDERNSFLFSSYNKAHIALINSRKSYSRNRYQIDLDKEWGRFREDFTVATLKEYFDVMYKKEGETFDGELINCDQLNFRLPGHLTKGIPWAINEGRTADLMSKQQWEIFLRELK